MMRLRFFMLLIASSFATAQTFSGTTGAISDDGTLTTYTVAVTGVPAALGGNYGIQSVCLDITHTWDSDLDVRLVSPDGTEITLFSGLGGDGDDYTDTCFLQTAAAGIVTASPPFTGSFRPQQSIGNLNDGGNGNGLWTLKVLDTYAFADTGSLNSWSIEFGPDAPTPFVFSSSNLPIVIINTNGVDIPDEPKIDALMGIIDNGPGQENHPSDIPNGYNGHIGIERRGSFSQGLPQKPYNLETRDAAGANLNVSLLGMPDEHDWCLLATYNDKVFVRNRLAFELFSMMGHYATRTRFCEVVLNGDYQGIYLLAEKIKRDNNRVDIAKLTPDENTGLNVTGGYIIKNDYWSDDDSWQLGFHPIDHPEVDVRLVYDYPKPADISTQQKAYIQGFIQNMETALYSDDFANPLNGYQKYLDVDSFIDYFIVNELSRNVDGFKKSWYFSKDKDSASEMAKLMAGPVWDFDWAWKNIWDCETFQATDGSGWSHLINDCGPDVSSNGWFVRLLQDPSFADRLRCRWETLRGTFLAEDTLDTWIDEQAALLDGAQQRHFERWGHLGVNTGTPEIEPDPATFEAQLAQFKNWIHLRLVWLDANIPGNAESCALSTATTAAHPVVAFPNPSSSVVNFRFGEGVHPRRVALFDVTGKVIETISMETSSLNVSALAPGLYFVRFSDGITPTTVKITVAH
ncbi:MULTISPECIES: CotH kinase family protein [unclassified Flavobacterium]|uniref:CotH kinase family protein n=1 Tax=unclassified Flavobacterium TaxID=196869 RepID=UPI001F139E1B|nr:MULTISPECIES: CotH kinase family protein [unclassified Flavobacterium]UMY65063.1 CotH kinase family protein [Flavobacterium sp. HJ-32-4]